MKKDIDIKDVEELFKKRDRKRFGVLERYFLSVLSKEKTLLLVVFVGQFSEEVKGKIAEELPLMLSSLRAKGHVELISGLGALYIDSKGNPIARVSLIEWGKKRWKRN